MDYHNSTPMDSSDRVKFSREILAVNSKISEFQKLEDDILSADLMPVLETMSNIKYSDSVTNANKYAESLTDLSHLGLEKSKKLQRGYLKPGFLAVWDHIKQVYNVPDDASFDWSQFGQDVSVFFSSVGSVDFLSGSLYVPPEKEQVEKEPKKKSEKRQREVVKEAVAPEEMITEETNEFTKITQSLHKRIKKDLTNKEKRAVPYLPEMIDRTSFTKTVENCFGSSFLISNGRLGMSIGENEEMQVSLTRPSEEGENQGRLNQGILSLNPKETYELLKKCGLAEDLDTGWNTKLLVC